MPSYTRVMTQTTTPKPSPYNATEGGKALPALHAYGVHTEGRPPSHPMPIYLGAQNTPSHTPSHTRLEAEAGPSQAGPSRAYDPAALLRGLLALLGLLLGLTLALGGWQPHTSEARLGWSHGSISVVEGTDGDTGSMPLSPHDEGVLPAPDNPPVDTVYNSTNSGHVSRPVDPGETFFEGGGPGGSSLHPLPGPVEA